MSEMWFHAWEALALIELPILIGLTGMGLILWYCDRKSGDRKKP